MIDYMTFVPMMIENFKNTTLEEIEHGLASDLIEDDFKGYAIIHYNDPSNKADHNAYVIYGAWETCGEMFDGIMVDEYKMRDGELECQTIDMDSFRDCVRRVRSMIGSGIKNKELEGEAK